MKLLLVVVIAALFAVVYSHSTDANTDSTVTIATNTPGTQGTVGASSAGTIDYVSTTQQHQHEASTETGVPTATASVFYVLSLSFVAMLWHARY
jgi:hypothetical protein